MNMKMISFFLLLSSGQIVADEIKLTSDLWCPYACEPNTEKPGFMVEIATEVFKSKGHTVKYELLNWARALKETRKGRFDGIVGASRSDVQGFSIPKTPAGYMENFYWTMPSHTWKYDNKESLGKVKVGVINEYTYGHEVDREVANKNPSIIVISGNEPLSRIIQMTESKRLDGFVENPMVLNYQLQKMNKRPNVFKSVSKNLSNDPDLFVAFSPSKPNSKEYAKMLDDGMLELRKSGKLKEILGKYGLKDWVRK
jgi:polar amino acid transport system substrate-binding protein